MLVQMGKFAEINALQFRKTDALRYVHDGKLANVKELHDKKAAVCTPEQAGKLIEVKLKQLVNA